MYEKICKNNNPASTMQGYCLQELLETVSSPLLEGQF